MELNIGSRLKPSHPLDVGKRFDSRYPLVTNIQCRGIPINERTITAIRLGDTSGNAIQLAAFASEFIETGSLTKTYQRLHNIIGVGRGENIRVTLKEERIDFRYQSEGFTQRLSDEIGEIQQTTGAILEATRAICVYMLRDRPDEFSRYFFEMENLLYDHMREPPERRDSKICDLHEQGIDNPLDWFRRVYADRGRGRWFGKLTPYQMDFFYKIIGDLSQSETIDPFSLQVLEYKKSHKEKIGNVINRMCKETGVPITPAAIELLFHLIYLSETGEG